MLFSNNRRTMRTDRNLSVLLFLAAVISTSYTAVIYAPTTPQPSLPTDIVGFIFQNPSNRTLAAQHIVFGHPFTKGLFRTPSPSVVVEATSGSQVTVPIQINVKATHTDGTVKHAVLVAQQPSLAVGESLPLMLTANPVSNLGSAVDLTNFPSTSVSVSMTFTGPAAQTFNLDVSQALKDAMASSNVSYFFQGPLATQGRVIVHVVSSFRMALDITLFSDNSYSVDIQYLNDIAMSPVGGIVNYTTSISAGGKTVYTATVDHFQYQTWHYVYYSNQEPLVNVQYNVLALIQTNAIPPYNYSRGINDALVSIAQTGMDSPTWGQPLDTYGVNKKMGTTGGRADIGILPLFTTAWILSQNDTLRRYTLGWGEAAGSTPVSYFAKNQSRWLNVIDYPNIWLDTRCNPYVPCPTQFVQELSWEMDSAHLPNLAFVPYMITGSRYYLDRMEAYAAWVTTSAWPAARAGDTQTDLGLVFGQQIRGTAWSMREVVYASYISPDDSSLRDYYDRFIFNHLSFLNNHTELWTSKTGEVHGVFLQFAYYGGDFTLPPWQLDFIASVISLLARQGYTMASEYMKWTKNWEVGRFNHYPPFLRENGVAYIVWYGNSSGFVKSWAQLQAEQDRRGYNNANFTNPTAAGYFSALGLMTLNLHHIDDPTDADTISALNWLANAGAPYTSENDFRNDPTYSAAPYPAPSTPNIMIGSPHNTQSPGVTTVTTGPTTSSLSLALRLNSVAILLVVAQMIALL